MANVVSYTHHNAMVRVREDLKGKHREHCLCWQNCMRFRPNRPDNCYIAQAVYENCVKYNIVTPMWECPYYIPKSAVLPNEQETQHPETA